jgi:hypothetical protein
MNQRIIWNEKPTEDTEKEYGILRLAKDARYNKAL